MPMPRPAARTPSQRPLPQRPFPRFRTLDLSPSVGGWQPLGHNQKPPALPSGFSPPRFTPQQQLANPDRPMTRVVKDVLRVGKWKIGTDSAGRPQLWDVTARELATLATSHQRATARGVAMNLTKSHGNLSTGIVPTDELICPIDEMIVANGVLWVSCYVTPQQARYLMNPACKVSPGIWDDWSDGYGNVYPSKMLHVAVTDHPVIPGQGAFIAMTNSRPRTLANGKRNMNFPGLVSKINALLNAASNGNVKLPADVSEDSIERDLSIILTGMGIAEASPADGFNADVSGGLTMGNRAAGKRNSRALFNPNRRRPTAQQCSNAAAKYYGTTPKKPA